MSMKPPLPVKIQEEDLKSTWSVEVHDESACDGVYRIVPASARTSSCCG